VAAVVTLGVAVLQQGFYPEPPSPERNLPAALEDYRRPLATAEGDVLVVGSLYSDLRDDPAAAEEILAGSAWYLNGHPVRNTYTTINFKAYFERYCVDYDGSTCPELLDVLFTPEPTTGRLRVDLLSVSTLLLVRSSLPQARLLDPPRGWHIGEEGRTTVTWVRDRALPTAGGPVWASPGTRVSMVSGDDTTVALRVDEVGAEGGRVTLSRVAWPGYRTDAGELVAPVDGSLVTLALPADVKGEVVTVAFSPAGWRVELVAWWTAVLGGLGWLLASRVTRRRARAASGSSVGSRS
jgi:hypothetical protein